MGDKKFIYAGPSWAKKSYDKVDVSETNLLKLWKLEDSAIDISRRGNAFNNSYNDLLSLDSDLPVIYITCEPLVINRPEEHLTICQEEDVMKFRKNIHENHMNILKDIKNSVAIIGAHTDVSYTDVSNSNNRIIDLSWQNFLLREANMPERYNFGADIIHKAWHLNNYKMKDQSTLEKTHSQFEVWDSLEKLGLMYGPHPTRKGNELYAEYIYDKVKEFINDRH
jgi:hypothetical protein